MRASKHVCKNVPLQMFYEERDALNTFLRPPDTHNRIWRATLNVNITIFAYTKTPQGTFKAGAARFIFPSHFPNNFRKE